MDAFATNYPGCTELIYGASGGVSLTISGADINDLTPLSVITYIRSLRISNNPLLTQLNGLHNLQSAVPNSTTLDLDDNPLLDNLSAFTGITFLDGLRVSNCTSLTNLEGLNFVTDFEVYRYYYLSINNNTLLTDISALSNISNFNNDYNNFSMFIHNNPVLSSLNGLQAFNEGYEFLSVVNNDALTDLTGLSDTIGVAEVFRIEDNDALESFNGIVDFGALELQVNNNTVLNDLSALNGNTFPSFLNITNNPNLAICNNTVFCASIVLCNDEPFNCGFIIENNASGCNSFAEIAFNCNVMPNNDECEGAIALTIGETVVAYNELATTSTQTPSCNDVDRADVWFTVNSGAFSSLDIISETGYSLQLWEGDCASLTQVANACSEGSLNDISVTTNTNYYVQVWSCASCRLATGLFDILVQDGTLTTETFAFDGFNLYPNPVESELNLVGKDTIESVAIYNLLGQEVLNSNPNTVKTSISTANLKSGIYLVKVRIGNSEATYEVVKE